MALADSLHLSFNDSLKFYNTFFSFSKSFDLFLISFLNLLLVTCFLFWLLWSLLLMFFTFIYFIFVYLLFFLIIFWLIFRGFVLFYGFFLIFLLVFLLFIFGLFLTFLVRYLFDVSFDLFFIAIMNLVSDSFGPFDDSLGFFW